MRTDLLDRPFGIYEKALASASWPAILTAARKAGFDFVEMSIDESSERLARLDWDANTRRQLTRELSAHKMSIFSICLSGHRRFGLGSADAGTRAHADALLERAIVLASDLGVRVIQIAGYWAYYERPDPAARRRYIDGLRRGLRSAARNGVMLAVENIDTTDTASVADCLDLRNELDSPWFQIYPDVGNLAVHSLDVAAQTALIGPAAVGVHLKDARPGEPRRVPFGSGTVPFLDVFDTLSTIGYEGPLTIEMWNDDPATAAAVSANALQWVKKSISAAAQRALSPEAAT